MILPNASKASPNVRLRAQDRAREDARWDAVIAKVAAEKADPLRAAAKHFLAVCEEVNEAGKGVWLNPSTGMWDLP